MQPRLHTPTAPEAKTLQSGVQLLSQNQFLRAWPGSPLGETTRDGLGTGASQEGSGPYVPWPSGWSSARKLFSWSPVGRLAIHVHCGDVKDMASPATPSQTHWAALLPDARLGASALTGRHWDQRHPAKGPGVPAPPPRCLEHRNTAGLRLGLGMPSQ